MRKMPLWRSMASTSVVLPWSTWATIAILRLALFIKVNGLLQGGVPPTFFCKNSILKELCLFCVQRYDSARLKYTCALRGEVSVADPLPLFRASVDSK